MSDARLREAYALHQAGRLAEAVSAYGRIIESDPNQFDALFLLGLVHLQGGSFREADHILGKAVALNPNSFDAWSARATALQQLGLREDTLAAFDRLIALRPDHALTWNNRANMLLELGRAADAVRSYDHAVALKPDYAEAWHNRGVARILLADYSGAESDLDRALLLKPDYADALEHRGVVLALQGRYDEALASYDAALKRRPANIALLRRIAESSMALGRLQESLVHYDHAIALSRGESDLWHNRGVVLSRLGRNEDALESYETALRLKPDFADAWLNRGNSMLAMGNQAEALSSYSGALEIAPDHFEGLKSRGMLLGRLQRPADALADFDRALSIRRDDAALWHERANALTRLNHEDEALESFAEALRLRPGDTVARFNRASLLARLARYEEAGRDAEAVLAADPEFPFARGLLMHVRQHVCDWRWFTEARGEIAAALRAGRRVIHPFGHLAISESPAEQLQCARILVEDAYPASTAPLWHGEPYRHEKIRVAYLSGDFYRHAIPFLIAGVFEHHDRERFETFGISYSPADGSEMRARLEKGFTRFIDVRDASDEAVAAMLREMEIDIAVDLKGYTVGARPGILARRPAPVQVHYLGYPGSIGADYIDYLIADRMIVPEEQRAFYAEQIVYLPDTYQCNDSRRRIGTCPLSRGEAGLPREAFVFCCFNGSHKILPEIFRIWMRILSKVEGSVLWLFEENAAAVANLRREAQASGIDAQRLIFAKRMSLEDHLARLQWADLVLDTLPYGAHTTASDALWVGVPVLTRLGEGFAGRVAASLLHAIGLPELVTHSAGQYEALACELAHDAARLAGIKAKLKDNRENTPLFDTARATHNLESAYIEMWQRHRRGERPASFVAGRPSPDTST